MATAQSVENAIRTKAAADPMLAEYIRLREANAEMLAYLQMTHNSMVVENGGPPECEFTGRDELGELIVRCGGKVNKYIDLVEPK